MSMTIRAALMLMMSLAVSTGADLSFTVSIPDPASHKFHVRLRCDGVRAPLQDFKLPQWSTGYYGIMNYARYVSNFRAADEAGNALPWEKTTRNTWRVVTGKAKKVVLEYEVFGATAFPASNYLGNDRAFLHPAGLFVHPAGQLERTVAVEIQKPPSWAYISTGLDPVKDKPGKFTAPDFDTLYDCPILIGNHERLQFPVRGIPHYVAIENVPASVSRPKMIEDLTNIVKASVQLMGGDIPYRHYTFLMMGRGGGGIEHSNSSANQFNGESLTNPGGYQRWLSFIAHEYFHHYNVKRIRPLALGPFDYDQENLTDLLWVSEGLSVYYQDLLLVRAGIMTREQYLDKMAAAISSFENSPGRNYQSATESSQNTWNAGSGVGGDRNTTISYYDNGAMLGAMLDLSIRHASGNRRSLDDVMRSLYRKFYLQQTRGFTAQEFRAECEAAAGRALDEVFAYAASTREVDYARHFALAGLRLEVTTEPASGGYIGLHTSTSELSPAEMPATSGPARGPRGGAPAFRLTVVDTAPESPAAQARLQPGDRILSIDGTAATAPVLHNAIQGKAPGQSITLKVINASGRERDVTVTIAANRKRTYRLAADATAASQIQESWLARTCCETQ